MKSNPQSTIHFRSLSVVPRRKEEEGLGDVKSVRLKPFHLGSLFVPEAFVSAELKLALPTTPTATAAMVVVLRNSRRLINLAFIFTFHRRRFEHWTSSTRSLRRATDSRTPGFASDSAR